ncbi:MAG TPA: hypothetical protein VMV93_12660 [Chloroflexota bacterium]|nr:hypothetical protein [Chloroflexota bacterium]
MIFRRSSAPAPLVAPAQDESARRQGSVEALNLLARAVQEAVAQARKEVEVGGTDNFVAGQMMAFGVVLSCIEREREMLLQQLVREAGLSNAADAPGWAAERSLQDALPVASEDLFRLAMDFRQMPAATAEEIELLAEGEAAAPEDVAPAGEVPANAPASSLPGGSQQPQGELFTTTEG